jgi:hypothetical protein
MLGFCVINKDIYLFIDDKVIIMVFINDILFLYRPELRLHAN